MNQTNNIIQNIIKDAAIDNNGALIKEQNNNLYIQIASNSTHNLEKYVIKKMNISYNQATRTINNQEQIKNYITDLIVHGVQGDKIEVSITSNQLLALQQHLQENNQYKIIFSKQIKKERKLCKKLELLFELIYKKYIYSVPFSDDIDFFIVIIKKLLFNKTDDIDQEEYTILESYPSKLGTLKEDYSIKFMLTNKIFNNITIHGYDHEFFLIALKKNEIYTVELQNILAIEFYTAAINSYIDNLEVYGEREKEDFFSIMGKSLGFA